MFKLNKVGSAKTAPMVYLEPVSNEDITLGEAVVYSSGKITACGATTKPEYITVGSGKNKKIACIRIEDDMEFATTNTANVSGVDVGEKVTMSSALEVTATTTSGVFEITGKAADAVGSIITGYFR